MGSIRSTPPVDQQDEILVIVAENQSRQIARVTGISKTKISETIHMKNLYPFHFTLVQHLPAIL